jgi:GNAT superfamily N-acetyltransferase
MVTTQLSEKIDLRPITKNDTAWLGQHLLSEWGGEPVVVDHRVFFPTQLPGFLAIVNEPEGEDILGEVTYAIDQAVCEIVTIASLQAGQGIGTALFQAVETTAREAGCQRLRLVTTSDNLDAIGFYQKRGMRIVGVLIDALDEVRRLKPHVGQIGMHGIPLQDALLLEKNIV